jgi:hypothetical protein
LLRDLGVGLCVFVLSIYEEQEQAACMRLECGYRYSLHLHVLSVIYSNVVCTSQIAWARHISYIREGWGWGAHVACCSACIMRNMAHDRALQAAGPEGRCYQEASEAGRLFRRPPASSEAPRRGWDGCCSAISVAITHSNSTEGFANEDPPTVAVRRAEPAAAS